VFVACIVVIFASRDGRNRDAELPRDTAPTTTADAPRAASSRDDATSGPTAGTRADFDFYLLAMTVHESWCADGHAGKRECGTGSDRPLVVHGLWPEKLEPRTYPHDCPGPKLSLDDATLEDLRPLMPGVQSGLHVHEWREHGTCSGLDDDDYFRHTIAFARELDAALGDVLATHANGELTSRALRVTADRARPGLGRQFTLHCRTVRDAPSSFRNRPYLVELRFCVDDDGAGRAPRTPLDCAAVNRRDQGCGDTFRIAGR
jgi:ribonuclease I